MRPRPPGVRNTCSTHGRSRATGASARSGSGVIFRFKARFGDGPTIERSSAERIYTHAWRVTIESGGEASHIHGFTISRDHAEMKIAEQRRMFSRPFSRVRVVEAEVVEASCEAGEAEPLRRRRLWA